jgi:hypothetical protein
MPSAIKELNINDYNNYINIMNGIKDIKNTVEQNATSVQAVHNIIIN